MAKNGVSLTEFKVKAAQDLEQDQAACIEQVVPVTLSFCSKGRTGRVLIKLFLCSAQLSMKFRSWINLI